MNLPETLRDFFSRPAFSAPGSFVVAFSGGTDSTALLAGLVALRAEVRSPVTDLVAAHLDHGSDPESEARARHARDLARRLEVPFVDERREISRLRACGESWETAARRVRYAFLEEVRRRRHAAWVVLAHHRDDQAETVLLRWLLGSGLRGLAAMRPASGTKLRPLLTLAKADLAAYVREQGLLPSEDPSNRGSESLRNRIRHALIPGLAAEEDLADLAPRLCRLAERAHRASIAVDRKLLEIFPGLEERPPALARDALSRLPSELFGPAVAALHRAAGLHPPPSRRAMGELRRQLGVGTDEERVASVAPRHIWRIEAERVTVERLPEPPSTETSESSGFSYTFSAPGRIEVPEARVTLTLKRSEFAPWMLEGHADRTALRLPATYPGAMEVRSRKPGDRMHPLGAPGSRKLKDVLIDRRVDRARRDALPLLCVDGSIAWAPGVAIDERFRVLGTEGPVWVAEIEPWLGPSTPTPSTGGVGPRGNPRGSHAVTSMEREPHPSSHDEVAEL